MGKNGTDVGAESDRMALTESLMLNEPPTTPDAYRPVLETDVDESGLESSGRDGIEPLEFNYYTTFSFMTGRRLQRRYRGVYRKYSFMAQFITWIMVIYVLLMLGGVALSSTASEQKYATPDMAFFFVVGMVFIYFFVQVALVIRWLLYWVIVAELFSYMITQNIHALFWLNEDELTQSEIRGRNITLTVFIVVEVLTVVVFVFTHYTYPWIVRKNILNTASWWKVELGPQSNTLTYRTWARFYNLKRDMVKYCGGLNEKNQPHGFGMWTDTSFHGERLTGQWENGIPIGPFRSFEYGSGYSFANIRVGYCHNRGEQRPDQIYFFPKLSQKQRLNWGVASIECSVSGGFFTFLPSVSHLTPFNSPEAPQSAAECLQTMRTPTDAVVYSGKSTDRKLKPNNTARLMRRQVFKESSNPVLDLSDNGGKEALVFLPGYNCSLDYGMTRIAQLLTLGDFPSYIHPFVFSWPSGGVLAYFQARTVGSESERTGDDFRDFLQSLIDAGYTTLNIIAHSMGARIYFNCLNRGLLDDILMPAQDGSQVFSLNGPSREKLFLSTLTFSNPDYDRNEFVKYGGGYDRSRKFCSHITLYADNLDGALYYTEFLTKKSVLGPLNYSLGKRGYMMHRDETHASSLSNTELHVYGENHVPQQVSMDEAVASINQQAKYPGVTSFAFNTAIVRPEIDQVHHRIVRRVQQVDEGSLKDYLDMDVIDTTWMDNNVHAIRHNYFNLNPTIVEDLRHLIVGKKRAESRPGLLKTTTARNVSIFLVAPSHVKNK